MWSIYLLAVVLPLGACITVTRGEYELFLGFLRVGMSNHGPTRLLQSLDAPRADLYSEVDSTNAAIVSLTLKVICVRLSNVMNFNVTRI